MKVQEIPTPALLLDAAALHTNLQQMASQASRAGKNLRPHAKAHKCLPLASLQMEAGAIGMCAATLPEAELLVRGGIGNVLLTSPLAEGSKIARLAALGPSVLAVVDHPEQVRLYQQAAQRAGSEISLLLDVDTGDHRTGIVPGQTALSLARQVVDASHLRFRGVQAYSVRASHLAPQDGVMEFARKAWMLALETCQLLTSHGISVEILTGGSTGSFAADITVPEITELQAGSYALMDSAYRRIGVPYAPALQVLATVISSTHADRVTVDAGFKAFSTDRPFGPDPVDLPGARYEWAGDEFGYVFADGLPLKIGDRVRFIPPHCDPTVNLYDRIYVCRDDQVEEIWPVMDRYAPPAGRISGLKPTAVNSILAQVRALPPSRPKPLSLMRGEPDFPTPEHIVEACIRALRDGRTGYPDNRGELPLRQAVAEKLLRENGLSYDPASEILITDGATLGVYAALMAALEPGDEILLPDPIYDAYQSPIRLAGAQARSIRSKLPNGRFQLTRQAMEAALGPRTRAMLLNTPWNPTGTVFTSAELQEIADFTRQHDLMLISDEIYESITYEGHRHISPATLLRDRCIVLNSFSKTYAMPGWRLGYCAAPAHYVNAMFLILQQSSRGPATFVQDAGQAALSGLQDCVRAMRSAYTERRQAVLDALMGLPRVRVLAPEGGFFAMLDVREIGMPSDVIRARLLQEHGVVVMPGSAYGEGGEGTLRVSFASGGENLSLGLAALRKGLSAL